MNFITQYKGLRRENYILFIGRIVTNLGSMIWPVQTLILNQKLGLSAAMVSIVMIFMGAIMLPAGMIGGKLADRFEKKKIIIICDTISVFFFVMCAFIPLSMISVVLISIGAACQNMEYPAYDALIADITYTKDRQKAYSLQYLGANIGLVASPTIAGILFKNYLWLSFLLSGLAIATSTVLIFFFIKNTTPVEETDDRAVYQESKEGASLISILKENKIIFLYIIIMGIYWAAYNQYGYLMPLDMGRVHGENGAVLYGSVSSVNCIVVVLFTPIITKLFAKLVNTKKNLLGQILLLIGYVVFLIFLGNIPVYYVAMVLFTFGEILTTIANGPYITERIPASHRGRINGFMGLIQSILQGICMYLIGVFYDMKGNVFAWSFIFGLLGVAILGSLVLIVWDKKRYKELYVKKD